MRSSNLRLDHAVEFSIDDAQLVKRICGRLVHPSSGRTYHEEFHPPRQPGKDDVTGEPLVKRADDNEQTLRRRLETYHQQTAPVVDYYRQQGIWSHLDASRSPDQVWHDLLAIVKSASNEKHRDRR